MNTHTCFAQSVASCPRPSPKSVAPASRRKTGLTLAVGLPALLLALPLIGVQQRAAAPRAAAPRPVSVDRSSHGSIRHVETHVVQRPVEVPRQPARPVQVPREPVRGGGFPSGAGPRGGVVVHHDVEVDFHHRRHWDGFAFGRRWAVLPVGCVALQIGGAPYYYDDGVYYQPADGGYQEVYPPLGAAVPQPPDGAIAIDAGGQTYYYAGGAFYVQQPDGTFAIAPTPIGVVVPELPPGAIQVSVSGTIAYQFNGIYYEPVFVNGVTQYQTFMP
ncbi:MAG TPA: DUF6515 family protein [Dongiaceae bacterium]|nr:DUF6515 family protein [Dongiaceae bacterium]